MAQNVQLDLIVDTSEAIANIDKMNGMTESMYQEFQRVGTSVISVGQNLLNVTSQIRNSLTEVLKIPIEFEDIIIEAARALDMTNQEVLDFKKSILSTAPGLGILNTEFAAFATEAGKLGIPKEEIAEFAVVVADVETATLAGTDIISKNFATIRAIFGLTVDELRAYGGAVNMVDDRIGGSFKTITDFVSRTGATGKLAGMDSDELAAMGATFARLGIQPERASRAMNSMFTRLLALESATPKAKNALADAGFVIEDLSNSLNEDFSGNFMTFLRDLEKLDSSTQLNTLVNVFGRDFADELATLLSGLNDYEEALGHIVDEQELLDKLQEETDKKMNTTRFKLDVVQSTLEKMAIILGDALLPIINNVLDAVTPVLEQFANWINENQELAQQLFIMFAVLSVIAPLLIIIGHAILSIAIILKVLSILSSPFGILITILGAVVIYLNSVYGLLSKIRQVFYSMFGENGLQSPDFTPLFGSGDSSSNTNINFNPVYYMQGVSSNLTDAFGNFLDMIKDNDNSFFDFLGNSSNRINRSVLG
ncbi:MAG: phage tail tape measure protein [Okeania sp. SIO4D6]|nr:phage tail tape measure protein [Okeania sp. SIO4D6]